MIGPLAGGAELRLSRVAADDGTIADEVTVWTPGGEETPVDLPDGVKPGTLTLSGPISADGTLALATTGTNGVTTGTWLFDLATDAFRAVTPASPSDNSNYCTVLAVTTDSEVSTCSSSPATTFVETPWDGSSTKKLSMQDAYARAWGAMGLAAQGVTGNGQPAAIVDAASSTSKPAFTEGTDGLTWWTSPTPVALGGGRFVVFADQWPHLVVAYDRTSGRTFTLESAWVPDTAQQSALTFVWFVEASPGSGE